VSDLKTRHLEELRFHVRSTSRFGVVHLVDLGERVPFGQCSCEFWQFSIGPKIKELKQQNLRRYCRHVRAAKDYLADRVIDQVIAERTKKGEGEQHGTT